MKTSDTLSELAAALSAAQAEMKAAPMTGRNPHLKNKYATLNDIIDTARGPLAAHGLAYVQMPTSPTDLAYGMIGLRTRLLHKSGEWLEDEMFFPVDPGSNRAVNPAQIAGGMLTYMRRYALAAMLGIVADEDADGNSPTEAAAPQRKPAAQPAAAAVDDGPLPDDEQAVFDASASEFVGMVAECLNTDGDNVKAWMKKMGHNKIPGIPEDRLAIYRKLRRIAERDAIDNIDDGNGNTGGGSGYPLYLELPAAEGLAPATQAPFFTDDPDAVQAGLATAQGLNE